MVLKISTLKPVSLLREPLLQFLLLGGLIFAVDYYVLLDANDPRRIVVNDKKLSQLVDIFKEGQGRDPTPNEIDRLIVKWTQNEIFFREAQQMGLDKGDDMIRNRLILKMRNILFNKVVIDVPPDSELEQWFKQNRSAYDIPTRYDVEQFHYKEAINESNANALARKLDSDPAPTQYSNGLRRYMKRPASNIASLFGQEDSDNLLNSPINQWLVVSTSRGWHLARVTQRYAAEPAIFADVRNRVIRDWKKNANEMQLAQQTKEITERYTIQLNFSSGLMKNLNESKPVATTYQPANASRQQLATR